MAKIYVANVSRQIFEFRYRIPEFTQERRVTIQPMSQVCLPDRELSTEQIGAIISQHAQYGFIAVEEIGSRTNKHKFAGQCYSIDKPVPAVKIEFQIIANQEVLEQRGREIRKETAIASSISLNNELEEQTRGTELAGRDLARNFVTELQEDEQKDGFGSTAPVNESFKVEDPKGSKIVSKGRRK